MTQWGLDTLFNPAKRHMDEEKRRLQATRQQVGDTSGGKRIDLESGKVRIPKKHDHVDEAATEAVVPDDADDEVMQGPREGTAEAVEPSPAKPARELTPAQQRAAERRRRKSS